MEEQNILPRTDQFEGPDQNRMTSDINILKTTVIPQETSQNSCQRSKEPLIKLRVEDVQAYVDSFRAFPNILDNNNTWLSRNSLKKEQDTIAPKDANENIYQEIKNEQSLEISFEPQNLETQISRLREKKFRTMKEVTPKGLEACSSSIDDSLQESDISSDEQEHDVQESPPTSSKKKRRLTKFSSSEFINFSSQAKSVQQKTINFRDQISGKNLTKSGLRRADSVGKKKLLKQRAHNWGFVDIDDTQQMQKTIASRFNKYYDQFLSLTKRDKISTVHLVMHAIITNSTPRRAILLTKKKDNNERLVILNYDLETKNAILKSKMVIDGIHILSDELVQNDEGSEFCIPYLDAGQYKVHVFDSHEDEIAILDSINERLGISHENNFNQTIETVSLGKNINCVLRQRDTVFVNIYDAFKRNNWNFKYNYRNKEFVGEPISISLDCSPQNFPLNFMYSKKYDEFYVIYRLGHFVCIYRNLEIAKKQDDIKRPNHKYPYDKISLEKQKFQGLEQGFLINDEIVVSRHADKVLFFKKTQSCSEIDEIYKQKIDKLKEEMVEEAFQSDENQLDDLNLPNWKLIFQMKIQGRLQSPDSNQLIVTDVEKINFYRFESQGIPILDGVIFNFMACNFFILEKNGRSVLSFMSNQEDFIVFQRKEHHTFLAKVSDSAVTYTSVVSMSKEKHFLISSKNQIAVKSQNSFKQLNQIGDDSSDSFLDNGKDNLILNMKLSPDERTLVVFQGKRLVKNSLCQVRKILVFSQEFDDFSEDWIKVKEHLYDKPKFISIKFEFCKNISDEIFLIDEQKLWKFNIKTGNQKKVVKFKQELVTQPDIFVMNEFQNIFFVSCLNKDAFFKDIKTKEEIDFDIEFEAEGVQQVICANGYFYILVNRIREQYGVFLIQLDQKNPRKKRFDSTQYHQKIEGLSMSQFVLKWPLKHEIGNADLYYYQKKKSIVDNLEDPSKYLVISFKVNEKNFYSVMIIELEKGSNRIVLRNEIWHMWEQYIKGILLDSGDFLILSLSGTRVLRILPHLKQKRIRDFDNKPVVLHQLHKCNYLKIQETNHILFSHSIDESFVEIIILDLEMKSFNLEQMQIEAYRIKIEQMSLVQTLLLQGLFSCSQQRQIAEIIQEQPDPSFFFKSLLELDAVNIVSIVSFDSKCIQALLHEKNQQFFKPQYPLFYKINNDEDLGESSSDKIFFKSAIDIAIFNHQIEGIQEILKYIIKYQNSFMHSCLFKDNFIKLLIRNINVVPLLESNILMTQFSNEEWPQTHCNPQRVMRPYNSTFFQLIQNYNNLFYGFIRNFSSRSNDLGVMYKISYKICMLPSLVDPDEQVSIMDVLSQTSQIDVFKTQPIQLIIEHKWNSYSSFFHVFFALIHAVYFIVFVIYINEIYLYKQFKNLKKYLFVMCCCNAVAMFYDLFQLRLTGLKDYLSDYWNYIDIVHVYCGFLNLYMQWNCYVESDSFQTDLGINDSKVKVFILISTLMMLFKTFFFLRIIPQMTQFVIMIGKVTKDLQNFIFFYCFFLLMFGIVLSILGIRSRTQSFDDEEGNTQNDTQQATEQENYIIWTIRGLLDYNAKPLENSIPSLVGNIIQIMRFSLGDFDFNVANQSKFGEFEVLLFWITWLLIVVITNIVALNFIIAEVSNSYDQIKEVVNQIILQERSSLIQESEDMLGNFVRQNKELNPNCIILREIEN